MKHPYHKDDDGTPTREGDAITFSYGIPPVRVEAKIVNRNGRLIALTPGHRPEECQLKQLRRHVAAWWRINPTP